jgi:hypothetical protein
MFVSEQHPTSRRFAEFEDDGTAGYLYLTAPDEMKPVGDCWVYNRIPPPEPSEIQKYRGLPPPAARGYVGPNAERPEPLEGSVCFLWSPDGNAVSVLIDGVPTGFLVFAEGGHGGYSLHLIKEGPWGKPWDEERFSEVFEPFG